MTLNLDIVGRRTTAGSPWTWTTHDSLLYALSVGADGNLTPADLAFTTDNSRGIPQQVVPSFAVVMGTGHNDLSMSDFGDFPMTQVLHAGQRFVLHSSIAPQGAVTSTGGVTAIYDKGKNAIIETRSTFTDAQSGELVAESIGQIMVRGEGGFGGDPGPRDTWTIPDRSADEVVSHQTSSNQALLYRLNGDTNPLHSDPTFAERAGFPKPILHGLCTYGFTTRAILDAVADGDVDRFGGFSGRFSSPVFPGDRLDTRIWRTGTGALFQTLVGDRVVIDRGEFTLR